MASNESSLEKIKLTKGDIPALKTIHNAAAGKGRHLRHLKNPETVYAAARKLDAAAVAKVASAAAAADLRVVVAVATP